MASIIELGPAWYLANLASSAHQKGELKKAEKLQRLLIEHAKIKWGLRSIVTAAASFDLVLLLEEQGKLEESHHLRIEIQQTLKMLGSCPRPLSSADHNKAS